MALWSKPWGGGTETPETLLCQPPIVIQKCGPEGYVDTAYWVRCGQLSNTVNPSGSLFQKLIQYLCKVIVKKLESKEPEKYAYVSVSSLIAAISVVLLFSSECIISLVL